MFTFCPLQGALSESLASQSLLELDGGVKVLVDLGWDESFSSDKLEELEKQVPTLSLILLTHATVSHLAAYAHCCKNIALFTRIPVYATRPVIDLGRTLTQDLYSSTPAAATTIRQSSLSETTYAYSQTPLKYSQPHQPLSSPFSPPLNGLTITAYNSGHTLGGTIWHIQHGLESIVYAVDWNQARENVFAGAAWLGGAGGGGAEVIEQLRKPTALICSSRGADKNAQAGGRAKRDEQLIEMIKTCVSRGGTVLIPVDSSARVLEISYLLEYAWRTDAANKDGVLKYSKLYLAGRNVSSTMRYARSMLEWMDNNIVQEFEAFAEGQRKVNGGSEKKEGAPFDFKYLRLLERKAQITKLLSQNIENGETQGRVILASDVSMDWGFSKDLVKGLAKDSRNLVILTERPNLAKDDAPSISRTLWEWWRERRDGISTEQASSGDSLEMVYSGGRELEQWLATQRQLQATQQAGGAGALEASADVVDDASSESSSDSEDEDEDLGINILIKKKTVFDFDTRGKRGRERSFPMAIRRKRNDDFGELIRPEDYLRAEEKEDEAVDNAQIAAEDDKLGKKRKWDDVAKQAAGANKRPNTNRTVAADDADAMDLADGAAADELDSVEDTEPEEPNGPCKLVYTSETVAVNLRIAMIDFSGLHDKRSLNMLIPLIQPRKLILVGGTREETTSLAADCRAALASDGDRSVDVFTPEVGTWVDASMDTNAWVVKLADPLVKKLKWQNVRGLGIVTITGQLLASALAQEADGQTHDDVANKRQKTEPSTSTAVALTNAADTASMPTLDVLPVNLISAARSAAQSLHVGDLRLADLRRAMQGAGHSAEFRGEGTLVVDGSVAVRKTAEGRIDVESVGLPLGGKRSTLYEVKRAIYDNLAVVAGA
ncbi:metallo-beta-lactamase superfamily domain-containing protein [Trichoderma breve]|uniref:Cleavage and polyadenylation specificity factor subunit 2 n=1 Tax=Trichoderma breve TaxID=2034170 RepID=A0A9W9EA71_9HYPO|nr:metallo-beta-lactamase superfamily domain-containing protein [Trichoderma breve]KAJ4862041.1 metallo-beta-lactamase superfamily domain-containing protein [Trichoderma breve]